MFWTRHKHSTKHGLLRAISGGPVYVSDRVGATDPEALRPLVYEDGRILMMDRSAKPTEDCIFINPTESGVLKLQNIASWGFDKKGGGIAAYNLTDRQQTVAFSPSDIPDLEMADWYWVYDYFKREVHPLGRNEMYSDTIDTEGFAWYVILPQGRNGSCLGLLDKYAGFLAVENIHEDENTEVVVLHEAGTLGWASEKDPGKVMVDTIDVTDQVKKNGNLYTLSLPEAASRTVLSIIW